MFLKNLTDSVTEKIGWGEIILKWVEQNWIWTIVICVVAILFILLVLLGLKVSLNIDVSRSNQYSKIKKMKGEK